MRIVAAILLFATTVILLLLGGSYILSSKFKEIAAREDARDYSLVAGDLADETTLNKEHERAKAEAGTAGSKQLVLGIVSLLLALVQLVCGIQVLRRRTGKLMLLVIGISAAVWIGIMAADAFYTVGIITTCMLALAFVLTLLVKPSAQVDESP